jgi:hypothetical protein
MFSKPIGVAVLGLAVVTGVAAGAYLTGRGSAPTAAAASQPASPAAQDTEAVISPSPTTDTTPPTPAPALEKSVSVATEPVEAVRPKAAPPVRTKQPAVNTPPAARPSSSTSAARTPAATTDAVASTPAPAPVADPAAPARVDPPSTEPAHVEPPRVDPPPPPAREFVELEVPSTSVLGLRIETPVSTETARIEDRVEARVMRDVSVDGRTAIPAGTRALGAVTMVERGGKVKERARLGVRFHTLVLADGAQLPIRSDTIIREGESPAGDSARKIGGAAVGGAILGALMGGKKGAIVGSTAGAAGGTAVVMAGDRNAATLPAGAVVTVKLNSPVSVEVEKK